MDASATTFLKGWTPLTTRLLEGGGSSAWSVIDGALGEDACAGIEQELTKSKLLEKLLPARTKSEAQADQIMSLLHMNNDSKQSSLSPAPLMIRGDKSLFLSREIRSDPRFPERHPNLHRLFETVQQTLVAKLSSSRIQLDTGDTSVQLAVYPGDGQSGYVRHCDRGQQFCREEESSGGDLRHVGRIITAIYYLTDYDWSATLDGGTLRVFHSKNESTDLVPYRDRLVLFRADAIEHQVLPSLRRPRMAITMWFYGKGLENAVQPSPTTTSQPAETNNKDSKQKETEGQETLRNNISSSALHGPAPLEISRSESEESNVSVKHSTSATIFVGIASYRDSETVPTLRSLFAQAQHPSRISVGLMLQLDEEQDGDLWSQVQDFMRQHPNHIRHLRMAARDASGPCYARALCQSLHRGEDYVLQFDSHMRLRRNWDTYLIQQHQRLVLGRDDRVVLTTYPVGYTLPNVVPNETRGTLLVPWKFDDSGLLRQRGRLMCPRADAVLSLLVAAGFLFGPRMLSQEVPYDPHLQQLFFGEELSLAVRLYTHGYDAYAPPETVCYHLWSRAHRPTQRPISHNEQEHRTASMDIVRQQVLGKKSSRSQHARYGLGTLRTAQEFAVALKVDFTSRSFLCDDVGNGALKNDSFVQSLDKNSLPVALFPPDSIEHKVTNLDFNTRQLIARFLPSG